MIQLNKLSYDITIKTNIVNLYNNSLIINNILNDILYNLQTIILIKCFKEYKLIHKNIYEHSNGQSIEYKFNILNHNILLFIEQYNSGNFEIYVYENIHENKLMNAHIDTNTNETVNISQYNNIIYQLIVKIDDNTNSCLSKMTYKYNFDTHIS
jgi:hypothetical protein